MTNVFIVHGVGGYPEENWFPWLKSELESLDCNVFVPQFPTPENQTLDGWLAVLDKYRGYLNGGSIVVGHSLGVSFLLNVLEENRIRAAFLVAGFVGKIDNEFDEGMKTFAQREFKWDKIKRNCRKFYIFYSDNDPYVKARKAKELSERLGTDAILVKNAGHFNTASGYTRFDFLLEMIKNEL
jgi:predicted alpha/beta hydrolase family esterase